MDTTPIPKPALDATLAQISRSVECTVCAEIMHVPVISSCGHSFCYECCTAWFETKTTCPTCRHELEDAPLMNVQLKEISGYLVDLMVAHSEPSVADPILQQQKEANLQYQYDKTNNRLYGDVFRSVMTLVDKSDGVPRCGNCHWEAHGSECMHCGARFRIPQEEDSYDSAYDDDDDVGSNRYDSQDSFVDGRDFEDIQNDVSSDSSWHGFYESDGDLHTAMEHFHSDGDEDGVAFGATQRNMPVIVLSDEEE